MTIEVRTAAPGCAERCPYFEVEVRDRKERKSFIRIKRVDDGEQIKIGE